MRPDASVLHYTARRAELIAERDAAGDAVAQETLDRLWSVECTLAWIERAYTPPEPRTPWWHVLLAFVFPQRGLA